MYTIIYSKRLNTTISQPTSIFNNKGEITFSQLYSVEELFEYFQKCGSSANFWKYNITKITQWCFKQALSTNRKTIKNSEFENILELLFCALLNKEQKVCLVFRKQLLNNEEFTTSADWYLTANGPGSLLKCQRKI